MKRNILLEKYIILFLVGGLAYYNIEVMWRGFSHVSMIICGGLGLILIGGLNQFFKKNLPILAQMVIGALIITLLEFAAGLIVNVWLKLNIWDYSAFPLNIMGQVCLLYSFMWFFMAGLCVFVDDWIRVKLFGETRPDYYL